MVKNVQSIISYRFWGFGYMNTLDDQLKTFNLDPFTSGVQTRKRVSAKIV